VPVRVPVQSSAEFVEALPSVSDGLEGAPRLKALDRKRERNLVFNLRRALMASLATEPVPVPTAVLHTTVLVVHSQWSGVLAHAPSRALGGLLTLMQGAIDDTAHATLRRFHALTTRYGQSGPQHMCTECVSAPHPSCVPSFPSAPLVAGTLLCLIRRPAKAPQATASPVPVRQRALRPPATLSPAVQMQRTFQISVWRT
jgi:hypothetical protein